MNIQIFEWNPFMEAVKYEKKMFILESRTWSNDLIFKEIIKGSLLISQVYIYRHINPTKFSIQERINE